MTNLGVELIFIVNLTRSKITMETNLCVCLQGRFLKGLTEVGTFSAGSAVSSGVLDWVQRRERAEQQPSSLCFLVWTL